MIPDSQVHHPVARGITAVGMTIFAGLSPSTIAAWLAVILNALLIADWFWKRLGRPYAIRHGWYVPRKPRAERYMEPTTKGDLDG